MDSSQNSVLECTSFYDQPHVEIENIPIGPGVKLGIEQVNNKAIGIGGAYGTWGDSYSNEALQQFIEDHLGEPLLVEEKMNLSELGFEYRQHLPKLSDQEHIDVEVEVGTRLLKSAISACGWKPAEIEAVIIGMSAPTCDDYTERIARQAGIQDQALKVSIHKACDSSVAGLNLILNPRLSIIEQLPYNIAEKLLDKKVLVGGIEGLSRIVSLTHDKNALQIFGNGAGIIGFIPGDSMKFLTGETLEAFDEEGVLQVYMLYPHSRNKSSNQSMIEVTQLGENNLRIAGMMHEPVRAEPVVMAGMMGMVKLFVRNGVLIVKDVYRNYRRQMEEAGTPDKGIAVMVTHHANLKINQLKGKNLQKEGIRLVTPWLLKDFGNVSAASNMIAFLRIVNQLKPGDHVLFDGFGAGTYYDVVVVELGGGC